MALIKHEKRGTAPSEVAWPEERFDRVFRDMFRDWFTGGALLERFFESPPNPVHLEEYVQDGTRVVRAEMPGLDPDKDVQITVADGMLTLQAHREERKEEDRPDGYRSEFRYGSFQRTVRLPDSATEADVKASYQDGILEVRIPVAATETTRTRIPIEHS